MVAGLKAAGPALLLLAALLVPFLGTAYTIDDTLFLRQAEQVTADPWHPTAFDIVWTEKPAPLRMSEIMVSGPAMAYLLVPAILAGGAEWVTHLTQLLLYALALVATASLALRLGLDRRAAAMAALLLAATPAALGMASSAMPDVPAMAFGIAGLERLFAWRDRGRWAAGALAAGFLALAILARSHLLLMLPIGVLLLLLTPRGTLAWNVPGRMPPVRLLLPLVLAPVLAALALVQLRDPEGPPSVIAATLRYSDGSALGANGVAFVTHWAMALPLAVPWAWVHWRRLVRSPVLYSTAIAIAWFLWDRQPSWRVAVIAAAGSASAAVLIDVLSDARRRKDGLQLVLGLALFVAIPVGVYEHLPSKYLLASAPAAALLIARLLARQPASVARPVLVLTMAAGVVLGVLIVRANAAFADLGRRAAQELIAGQVAQGRAVWFAGHWGFQWYAERAGARCLTLRGQAPRPGDLVVSSQNSMGGIVDVVHARSLISVLDNDTPGGRTISRAAGAGFYSNAWGYLPWSWSDDVLDRYTLWRVDDAATPLR